MVRGSTDLSTDLSAASLVAVRDCMGLSPGERVLVITDEPLRSIGYALRDAAINLGNEVLIVEILPGRSHGEEPPPEVGAIMGSFDVVLCPTSMSLTHTDARRTASARGARIATLPGVTEAMMARCMAADYGAVAARSLALARLMEETSVIRVTSPRGTNVQLPVRCRRALASTGLFHKKGQSGNLPTGEAFLAPLEGQSSGVVVVDGSMAGVGLVRTPIHITIENGYATAIEGGTEAAHLRTLLEPHGRNAYAVAEFGIGTNDRAMVTGEILEDEKVMGTIHVAFGDNKSMGGSVRVASHLDGLVTQPSVWFDQYLIMKDGQLLVD